MGKKRFIKPTNVRTLTESDFILITEESNGQIFFEIGTEITTDIAEAVSILLRTPNVPESIWNRVLPINIDSIDTKKSLYWLSGGDNEWITLHNYKKPWTNCNFLYDEKYKNIIISILKKSKSLKDIRNGFIKQLNLNTLYEFALNERLV
jgi:hypothetical protein